MLKAYRADLHIHSVLSPCTELTEMSPRAIVERACQMGLDVIAICDHNSCENVPPARKLSHTTSLVVLAGMEITSREEVHTLGLFDKEEEAFEVQKVVYATLAGENDEETFGYQVVVNEKDEVEYLNKRLLMGATLLSLEKVVELIHAYNGLAIASHVDREAYSILGQLGFIPPGLALDALELSPRMNFEKALLRFPQCRGFPFITSSDAHTLEEIGKSSTTFFMETVSVAEMKQALLNRNGRKVLL